ncbi:hypothetical protein CK203_088025 [Vitis vinifera]|uniref:Uncharacterized protein n=1 Tax=Vitis vinifera TaxID=29760 RepID=A0A438ER76_VITVI|nr:hypothetical protein CK203_088025 [Vitis vinifera]
MLLQKWVFLVTLWVLIISHGSADSGEVLGYGMPSPTACVNDPCRPLLSPPAPSLSGYPSYGTPPPPSPLFGYPSYRGPPPPTPLSGYPSYGTPPPPPSLSGYPSYGAPPPPTTQASPSTPGQGCSPPAPVQCCLYGPPAPYEYLPNQNYSAPSPLPLSWAQKQKELLSLCSLLTMVDCPTWGLSKVNGSGLVEWAWLVHPIFSRKERLKEDAIPPPSLNSSRAQ